MTAVLKVDSVLPGTGYLKLINFNPPTFTDGVANLVGLYTFGADADGSMFNFANSALPLLKTGTPTMSDVGALLGAGSFYDTQLPSTSALSYIAVAKPHLGTSTTGVPIVTNYQNSTPASGDGAAFNNGWRGVAGISTGVTQSNVTTSGADTSVFNTFAGRIKATGEQKVYRQVSGVLTQGTETAAGTRAVTTRTFRIGADYAGLTSGQGTVAMIAIFNTDLTDAQFANNFSYLRNAWGPGFGITTL